MKDFKTQLKTIIAKEYVVTRAVPWDEDDQEVLNAILTLIDREIIGKDEFANANKMDTPEYLDAFARNELKAEQRNNLGLGADGE